MCKLRGSFAMDLVKLKSISLKCLSFGWFPIFNIYIYISPLHISTNMSTIYIYISTGYHYLSWYMFIYTVCGWEYVYINKCVYIWKLYIYNVLPWLVWWVAFVTFLFKINGSVLCHFFWCLFSVFFMCFF